MVGFGEVLIMAFTSNRKEFVAELMGKLTYAMEAEGEQSMNEIRQSIGTQYPPASSPGHPPNRRTGNLQDGVEFQVDPKAKSIDLIVFSNRVEDSPDVPERLEFGDTQILPRPYMTPAMERTANRLLGKVEEALRV